MFCVKCGVELENTESRCPLCQTRVYHPEVLRPAAEPLYPAGRIPENPKVEKAMPAALTVLVFLTMVLVLLCDLQANQEVVWSGYVMGALAVGYVVLVLPGWFTKANPVIFVPSGFVAATAYIWYIQLETGGTWFFPFALPVAAGVCLIVTTLVTLLRYLSKGRIYIVGGCIMGLGAFMLPVELLLNEAFHCSHFVGWSVYPLAVLVILGGFLIFLGICRPLRESMERKFFF